MLGGGAAARPLAMAEHEQTGCTMLPLIKRAAEVSTRRDRGRALPMRQGGKAPMPSDFSVGCEVLVPRVHRNGRTFSTWCTVLEVHAAGRLIVDVPGEDNQPVTMTQLQRVAELEAEGPAGQPAAGRQRVDFTCQSSGLTIAYRKRVPIEDI